MAKDTAEEPGLIPGTAEQAALEAARAEYQSLLKAYQSDPSKQVLGGTNNEEYIALKQAGDAKDAAENAYYLALRDTTDDPFRYNPRNNPDTGYFTDAEGNFGLGMLPENYYYNDYSGTAVEGVPGWDGSPSDGLSLGGAGPAPATAGQDGQDPFAPPPNYQQSGGNGLPNGGIPEGYLPDSQGNSYWDYVTNGGTVPNVPGYAGRYVLPNGSFTNRNFGQGGGAVTGPNPTDWSAFEGIVPDLQGWEASTNKDFYQKQFQSLGAQRNAMQQAEIAAAVRAQNAANRPPAEPEDPWGWANLPQVQMGGSVAASPIEWGLNSNYGITEGMTNRDAVGAMSQLLTPQEQAMMTQHWQDSPATAQGTRWTTAGSPTALLGSLGQNSTLSPEFANTLQKVFNNIYTQTGGGTGGISVPEGYANPVNM